MTTTLQFKFAGRMERMPCIAVPSVLLFITSEGEIEKRECRDTAKSKQQIVSLS